MSDKLRITVPSSLLFKKTQNEQNVAGNLTSVITFFSKAETT